jgi:hypothetical protein
MNVNCGKTEFVNGTYVAQLVDLTSGFLDLSAPFLLHNADDTLMLDHEFFNFGVLQLQIVLLLLQLDKCRRELVACRIELVLDGRTLFPFL